MLLAAAVALLTATSADADVQPGPYVDTVLSRSGALLWYTGFIPVGGRLRKDMDALCQTVPVAGVSGWRAPTMAELETLMTPVQRTNAVTSWIELYLTNDRLFLPTIAPYVFGSRLHERVTFVSRNLYTYEGQPTTLNRLVRGRMYHIHWFERHSHPWVSRQRSITHTPGERTMGNSDRLLCVSER